MSAYAARKAALHRKHRQFKTGLMNDLITHLFSGSELVNKTRAALRDKYGNAFVLLSFSEHRVFLLHFLPAVVTRHLTTQHSTGQKHSLLCRRYMCVFSWIRSRYPDCRRLKSCCYCGWLLIRITYHNLLIRVNRVTVMTVEIFAVFLEKRGRLTSSTLF